MSEGRSRRMRLLGGTPAIAGGGEPPHDDGMEQRVAALEADVKDLKAGVSRLELGVATILAKLEGVASAAQFAALDERLNAQSERLAKMETAMTDTVKLALSKTIGVGGAIGLFLSMAAVVTVALTVLRALHLI